MENFTTQPNPAHRSDWAWLAKLSTGYVYRHINRALAIERRAEYLCESTEPENIELEKKISPPKQGDITPIIQNITHLKSISPIFQRGEPKWA